MTALEDREPSEIMVEHLVGKIDRLCPFLHPCSLRMYGRQPRCGEDSIAGILNTSLDASRLTRISLCGMSINLLFPLLRKASQALQSLHLDDIQDCDYDARTHNCTTLTFPRLVELSLENIDDPLVDIFLEQQCLLYQIVRRMTCLQRLDLDTCDWLGDGLLIRERIWPITEMYIWAFNDCSDAREEEEEDGVFIANDLARHLPHLEIFETEFVDSDAVTALPRHVKTLKLGETESPALYALKDMLSDPTEFPSLSRLQLRDMTTDEGRAMESEEPKKEWQECVCQLERTCRKRGIQFGLDHLLKSSLM